MTQAKLEKFFNYLRSQKWSVFGPVKTSETEKEEAKEISPYLKAHLPDGHKPPPTGDIYIQEIEKFSDLFLGDELPVYPWKSFFVPEREVLFEYKNGAYKSPPTPLYERGEKKTALFGINLLDLKAVSLYDAVFAKDIYYQKRRKASLIIGYASNLKKDVYRRDYEPGILKRVKFDIFLLGFNPSQPPKAELSSGFTLRGGEIKRTSAAIPPLNLRGGEGELKLFAGSLRGQRILEHADFRNYEKIDFEGPAVNLERMNDLRDKLKNHHNQKIWDELGRRCIECGKCTISCPTCFCFRVDDNIGLEKNTGQRQRCWDSCYYQEFSEVSGADAPGRGKPKFLNTTAQRIHFWYYHKFARIPDEFGIQGCVGCLRCHKVCPVGIDIKEVLEEVKKS